MTVHSKSMVPESAGGPGAIPMTAGGSDAVRIPAVRVDAFCESPDFWPELALALDDRRMARATSEQHKGGIKTAIAHYRKNPSPNLILLETDVGGAELLELLETLATVCEAKTRLILVGNSNDVALYRALVRRGVTEYLCKPADSGMILGAIADAFSEPAAGKVGRVYAFVGSRGGTGSSMLAHNVAWTLAERSSSSVILVDLDLPFGTAALDFDLRPDKTISEAVRDSARVDEQLVESLLTPCGERFGILSAPARLDAGETGDAPAFEAILDAAQRAAGHVVLDVPHLWCEWTRKMLVAADEVVITATPDLASLRNTHNLLDLLRQARRHDPDPKILLNQVGMPRRPEIKAADFSEVLGMKPLATIPFDAKVFGSATNTGRMINKVAGGSRYSALLRGISEAVAGCSLAEKRRSGGLRGLLRRGRG